MLILACTLILTRSGETNMHVHLEGERGMDRERDRPTTTYPLENKKESIQRHQRLREKYRYVSIYVNRRGKEASHGERRANVRSRGGSRLGVYVHQRCLYEWKRMFSQEASEFSFKFFSFLSFFFSSSTERQTKQSPDDCIQIEEEMPFSH